MNDDIKSWVINWFQANTDASENEIGDSDNYFEKGWIDSLKFISFITDLETSFAVRFSNEEFQDRKFSTVQGIVEILRGKLDGRQ